MTHEISVDDSGRVVYEQKPRPLGWLAHWTWSPERIQQQIADALLSEEQRRERPRNAYRAYRELSGSRGGNLFRIVEHLLGT